MTTTIKYDKKTVVFNREKEINKYKKVFGNKLSDKQIYDLILAKYISDITNSI